MAKGKYSKGRKIYNSDKIQVQKLPEIPKKLNPRLNLITESQFGSGMTQYRGKVQCSLKKKIPDIQSLEKDVLRYIVGQDKQVRQIITAIYRTIKLKTIKSNVLIIGSSGTGKTETIRQIAKRLNIPYTIEDATKYTQEGYYGADVNDMIYNLIENANNDIEKAKSGMIVIDEIDKKTGHEQHDVAGVEVLKSLLKIIEGATIKVDISENIFHEEAVDFETNNLIIVFLGAFSGLEKIRDKRLNTKPLGFSANNVKEEGRQQSRFLKQDLVKYGMPEEFVGRIDTIIEMNKLTKKDLTLILKKSKLSIFERYKSELISMGITLYFDSEIFERIAEESLALDTGARELSNIVNYMFESIMYNVLANPGKYSKCILDLDIVHDNTKYTLS